MTTTTELRSMVESLAESLNLVGAGELTATDVADTDTWGLPGERVTMLDWTEAQALEVYATGRWSPLTDQWTVTDWTIVTTLGGPDIRVTVNLIGGGAKVDGVWGGEQVTTWLTSDAAAALEQIAIDQVDVGHLI